MKKSDQPKSTPNAAAIPFRTKVWQMGNNTAIQLSPEIIEKLGSGRRPLVRMTIKNYTYRSAVAVMDGMFLVSLSAQPRYRRVSSKTSASSWTWRPGCEAL